MSGQSGQPRQSATQTRAAGPLGATTVQSALDLLAIAGPFFTTESNPSFAITTSFTTLKSFTISPGTTRMLFALLQITGGTPPAPTSAPLVLVAGATRTSGGVTTVSGLATLSASTMPGFNVRWIVSGVNADVQIRSSSGGAGAARTRLQYAWLEQTPP